MSFVQTDRLLRIDSPLGKDVLLVRSLNASESISRPFRVSLDLLSRNGSIDFRKFIGNKLCVTLELPDGKERYFHGIVSRFAWLGQDDRFTTYRAEVVPWLWLLTRQVDCRVFQNMTVPQVIQKVFEDAGQHDFDIANLGSSYDKWDYCVQYRETHFNFVSRLMEHYGISYFFRHEKNKHVMVLVDDPGDFRTCPNQDKADFLPAKDVAGVSSFVEDWSREDQLESGKYVINDYDFTQPKTKLLAESDARIDIDAAADLEVFDYPGEYERPGVGSALAAVRMEEVEADREVYAGTTSCRGFIAGHRFTLRGHRSNKAFNTEYLLTEVTHSALVGSYGSGDAGASSYTNRVTAIRTDVHFRPARLTPKPVVQGLHTALVVGPKGEEIHTDEYGRVRVQFFWDRHGKKDDKSSCFVRVAQPLAGRRWGFSGVPRIGQEVVVAFLEGDPDWPLIIGSVYNGEQMPPYLGKGLDPKHGHNFNITGYKSNSTKGGDGFNEWRFDDTKGKEQIFIHGERNLDVRIKKDSMEHVGGNRHLNVIGSQHEQIGGDKHLYVKTNHVEKIDGAMMLEVVKDQDITVSACKTETVASDLDLSVGGERKEQVSGDDSLTVGKNLQAKVGQKTAVESGQEIHLKAGMKVVLEAGMQITLKGAGGFVDIGPSGVTIQGTMVLINSGGAAGAGSGSSPKAPKKAKKEKPKEPVKADESKSGTKSAG